MKKGPTLFLKIILVLIAVVVFAGLVWFPKTEGRAANLSLFSIYSDPFILYIYIASIPFFVALYQAYKLLGFVERNSVFSSASVKTVQTIKYCAICIVGFLALAIFYIRFFVHGDDPAGPTMLGFIAILTSAAIATAAGILERLLQNAVDMKSENDLTV